MSVAYSIRRATQVRRSLTRTSSAFCPPPMLLDILPQLLCCPVGRRYMHGAQTGPPIAVVPQSTLWCTCPPPLPRLLPPGCIGMRSEWSNDYGMHDHDYTPPPPQTMSRRGITRLWGHIMVISGLAQPLPHSPGLGPPQYCSRGLAVRCIALVRSSG